MCYHTKQSKKATEVMKRFKANIERPDLFKENAIYSVFNYPHTPVIIDKETELIKEFYWGLIPVWATDETIREYTRNARIESIKEKPSFKGNIKNRCLIISDGIYEWQWLDPKGKEKQKYEITTPNNELFSFAGLYSTWVDKSTGEIRNTYTIVTTEANPFFAEIHNSKKRMPVILSPEREKDWLSGAEIMDFVKDEVELKAEKCM